MQLSAAIIYYELSKRHEIMALICPDKRMDLRMPRLYGGESHFTAHTLYVAKGADLPERTEIGAGALIVCCDTKPPASYENRGCSLLWFATPQPAPAILNELLTVYENYQNWDKALDNLLHDGGTPQDMLDASQLQMGNLLVVTDAAMRVTALFVPEVLDDQGQVVPRPYKNLPGPEDIGGEDFRRRMVSIKDTRQVFYNDTGLGDEISIPTINRFLFDGSLRVGILTMQPFPRPFSPHDYQLIEYLAGYVEAAIVRGQLSEFEHTGRLDGLIRDMLEQKHIDEQMLRWQLDYAGFSAGDIYICLAVQGQNMSYEYAIYLNRWLASKVAGSIIFPFNDLVAVVINTTFASCRMADYRREMESLLRTLALCGGISDEFTDLLQCRRYFAQAAIALGYGIHDKKAATLFPFDDYRCRYARESCSGALNPQMLFPAGLRRLIEHDQNSSVSYMETLRVFLDENMNAAAAAKRLFIQRNSLTSRLERLCALLNENLNDPNIRWHLNLCLYLYYLENKL